MLKQYQALTGALMGALVVVGLAMWFVFPPSEGDYWSAPPMWIVFAVMGVCLVVHLVCEAVGYRTDAVPPGLPRRAAAEQALHAWHSSMIMRVAIIESVVIAVLAVAFVLPDGAFVLYTFTGLHALSLMRYHVWPWDRPVNKTTVSLEREGGVSYLREVLGLDQWTGADGEKPTGQVNRGS